MNIVIMIPSLNPDETLLRVVESIRAEGFTRFLIINDGSKPEYLGIFEQLADSGCTVLHHSVNLGKGRALKTGFNHVLLHMKDADGVVTCDADGQHEPAAIKAVAQSVSENPDAVTLGIRKFFEAKVPLPNLLGNTITRLVFWLLTGLSFGDTQCGLRGFPMSVLPKMMGVIGERFEYENVMLLAFRKNKHDYVELPIRAVYQSAEEGRISHFNKALDPFRIYSKLIGFAAAPILAGLLATWLFSLLVPYIALWLAALLSVGIGWLALWIATPAGKASQALLISVGHTALYAALATVLSLLLIPGIGCWWLAAIVCVPLGYSLWLRARFGTKPNRIKK